MSKDSAFSLAGTIPSHVAPRVHTFYWRADDLRHCKVCGGGEGSLPTDCPGSWMPEPVEAAVFAGALDYIAGAWTVKTIASASGETNG